MKYILSLVGIAAVCVGFFCFSNKKEEENENLRIHIVANSTAQVDQNMKYIVKDCVAEYLSDMLDGVDQEIEAKGKIENNLEKITAFVNQTLAKNNAKYTSKVTFFKEKVPFRAYSNQVLPEGEYQCLKIELGKARGDNWWCVIYPNVCFEK